MPSPALEQLIERATTDEAFAQRLQAEPEAVMAECGLTDEERRALRSGDESQLQALGLGERASKRFSGYSDRDAKTAFAPVDEREVLKRLAEIRVESWAYKTAPAVRHIGPMAQDFAAAFRVGEDDRYIDLIDANGVAMAAIQGLRRLVREQEGRIAALEARLAALERTPVGRE